MKKVIGAVLLLAGVALFELCVWKLTQVGSCQSGGPQEIRYECPHSTWTWLGLIVPAAILALIGAGIVGAVQWIFNLGWILSGIVAIAAVYSPGAHAGSKQGGVIMGIVWIGLGLLFCLLSLRPGKRGAKPVPG